MTTQIRREEFLDCLGVVKNDAVEIAVERAGVEMTVTVPLQPAAPSIPSQPARPWVGFEVPHTGFPFSVSHKRYIRSNPDNDPEDALYPDVPVYATLRDIVEGIDPKLEKLKSLIKQNSP